VEDPEHVRKHFEWEPGDPRLAREERDSETGCDYFGARYYCNSIGRFLVPDWAARPATVPYAVFGDPQSLNLYGYVRNDPVSRADLDGHYWGFGLGGEPVVRGSELKGNG